MSKQQEAMRLALEALTIYSDAQCSPKGRNAITALRTALAKAEEDRAWVEERKANWAEDKALAKRNALEEADRIRKAEEDGLCWACGHKAEVALAEQEQEPVAWLSKNSSIIDGLWETEETISLYDDGGQPLYTAPPQRKPLTDEELYGIAVVARIGNLHDLRIAIEDKLKERNI